MKFLHPIFMLLLLGFLYKIFKTGSEALKISEKSPDADKRIALLSEHKKTAKLVTGLIFLGFIGGIFGLVYFLGVKEIFLRTYGHGFIGAGILGLMLSNIFVGKSVNKPARPKARENLLGFHKGLMYFTLIASFLSLLTGIAVLYLGPST